MLSFMATVVAGILTLGIALPQAKAQGAISPYPVIQGKVYKFEKVADGVYYGTGGVGGNHPVIVNENDVVLVDSGSTPSAARDLLADIKLITDKPVRTVINTHFHYDHTDGNSAFGTEVSIIGHEFVRKAMLTSDVVQRDVRIWMIEGFKQQAAAESDAAQRAGLLKQAADLQAVIDEMKDVRLIPPNVTYASTMTLHSGSREIDLLFLGRGHTGGDTVIYLPKEKIVCTGDLMETRIAYFGDAYLDEWPTTLELLKKLDFTLALPGHGQPFSNKELITTFGRYLKDVTARVATLRKQGASPEEAALRVDMTDYQSFFPDIRGTGADLRGVRHIYDWLNQQEKK